METEVAPVEPTAPVSNLADDIAKKLAASFNADPAVPESAKTEPTAPEPTGGEETPEVDVEKPVEADVPEVGLDDFLSEGEESAEVEEIEIPEDVKKQGAKAEETWGTLKKEAKTAKAQAAELAKEVATLKAKLEKAPEVDASKEVEALRKELAERDRIISSVAVQESAEYKAAVSDPAERVAIKAKALGGDEVQKNAILAAIFEVDEGVRFQKLSEIAEEMNPAVSARMFSLADQMESIYEKEREILQNAQIAKQEIERNRLAEKGQETEKEKAARLAAADTVWKNIVKKMPFLADEDGEVLPDFKEVMEKGRQGITPDMQLSTQVFAGYAAQLVPKLVTMNARKDARISELEASIKALKGASPSLKSGGGKPAPNPDKPLVESILEQARSQGIVR